jgi:hypothetical protein
VTGWRDELERFLATDPHDVGCDRAMAVMPVYVELLADDLDAAAQYPGAAAHFTSCGSCAEAVEGLLAAVRADLHADRDRDQA